MARKFSSKEREFEFWTQLLTAFSQVTFGVFWAAVFLPLEEYKLSVVALNAVATLVLVLLGRAFVRKG